MTYGRIIAPPFSDYHGATLTADLAIGDTTITVSDVGDFDEDAAIHDGTLMFGISYDVNGNLDVSTASLVPYLTFDEETSSITLAAPSAIAADSGDRVWILDPVTSAPVVDVTAYVEIEGADLDGDPLAAIVSYALIDSVISSGDDAAGQAVTLDEDEDEQLIITEVHGSGFRSARATNADQDSTTATGPGDVIVRLKHVPMPNSEHVYWSGVYQPGNLWTRAGKVLTLTDPDNWIETGDEVVVEYLWTSGDQPLPVRAQLEFVGSRVLPNGGVTEIDLPDGTQSGDLLLLSVGCGGFTSVEPVISDARMFEVYQPIQGGHTRKAVALGRADETTTPVQVHVVDPEGNGKVALAAYRVTGDITWDHSGGVGTPFVPDMPGGTYKRGLMVASYASADFDVVPTDAWTRDVLAYSTNQRQTMWENSTGAIPVTLADVAEWIAITIGVSDA